jgi:NADH-quinone oxidoreductase subunit F
MAIAGYCIGATVGYNYIRGEFYEPIERFEGALKEAYATGLIGHDIQGSGIDFDLYTHLGAGAYICGEETALLESIEGKKGQPRYKPPFPAQSGLYGRPTTINNTESLASVPVILEKGGKWFLEQGRPNNGGPKLFSITGHVNNPCNVEVPLGTPFRDLLAMAGGVKDGKALKAVIPGGSSVPVVPGEVMMETDMDYDSIAKAGSMLGSGAVIVIAEGTDMVKVLHNLAHFYMNESCGQCTPCREGTGWLERVIRRILEGQGRPQDLDLLDSVAGRIGGRTICALGDAAAMPVQSFLKHYRHEFEALIAPGRSAAA